MAVVTLPVFCIAVKLPEVAVVVLLLKIFPFAVKVLMLPPFAIPTREALEDVPVMAQLRMELLLMFNVMVVFPPAASMQRNVPEVWLLVMVIVLFLILQVKVPEGLDAV